MQVNMSLIPEFENLWKSFNQDPVKKKFLKIEGIAEEGISRLRIRTHCLLLIL